VRLLTSSPTFFVVGPGVALSESGDLGLRDATLSVSGLPGLLVGKIVSSGATHAFSIYFGVGVK
jgi:hypothetical protein